MEAGMAYTLDMKQVLVIPGGNSFANHEDYIQYLQERPVDLDFGNKADWKTTLSEQLGGECQVISPRMPNRDNARYDEWKLWFERHIDLLEDGIILIGHSLGGSFLTKYLATETIRKQVRATMIVAGVFDGFVPGCGDFLVTGPLDRLTEQGGDIHLYFSTDDAVVPYEELGKYRAALPEAVVHSFTDRGHFNQEEFPELVTDIKNLT
jgi:hypothetical protein